MITPTKRVRSPKGAITVRKVVQRSGGRVYQYWTINGLTENGARKTPLYRTEREARNEADRFRAEQKNFGLSAMELPVRTRAEVAACLGKLNPFGRGITDAVDFYVRHLQEQSKLDGSRTLADCLSNFVAEKDQLAKRGDIRSVSLGNIRSRAKRLGETFGLMPIKGIGSKDLSEFLAGLPLSQVTKNHYRAFLSEFFSYALEREWIEGNPMKVWGRIKRPRKNQSKEVQILTVPETRQLLEVAKKDNMAEIFVPYAALGLFLGLRPNEARLLNWSDINLEDESIEIKGFTSKVKSTRHIEINPTALAWLRGYKLRTTKTIMPLSDYEYRVSWDRIRNLAGWKVWEPNKVIKGNQTTLKDWPEDCLRHCYASYWLPIHNDRPRLAEHMGTSTNVIQNYYRKSLPAKMASEYWDVLP